MIRSRLLALGLAAVGALTLASPALADDRPEFTVIPFNAALGRVGDTELVLTVPKELPPTAKLVVYVPGGYGANLTATPGTRIGTATGAAIAKAAGGATVQLSGTISADTPSTYASNPQAQACAPGAHTAVWLLNLTGSGRTLTIPIFVDPTNGADAALGLYKLQMCFASPDLPEASGGAPLGAQLIEATLDFPAVFTNPPTPGEFVWRAFVTPYVGGAANPGATVEVRSLAALPAGVILRAKVNAKKGTVTISGTLVLGGSPQAGLVVSIFSSPKSNLTGLKKLASVKTKAKGVFSVTRKITRTTYFWAYIAGYYADTCISGPSTAPLGCVRETLAPAFANRATAKVPVKKKKK